MKKSIIGVVLVYCVVTLVFEGHQLSLAMSRLSEMHEMGDQELHLMPEGNNKISFNYQRKVDPSSYRPPLPIRPQIMQFLPLTQHNGKQMLPLNSNIEKIRASFVANVGYDKTVDMIQARKLAHLFTSDLGKAILTYFWGLTPSGLNYYNLGPRNYRLWLAIKILAGKDIKKYARSMVEDMELFGEFYKQAWLKQNQEIQGIPRPTALDLVKAYHSDLLKTKAPAAKAEKNKIAPKVKAKLHTSNSPAPASTAQKPTQHQENPKNSKKTPKKASPKAQKPKSSSPSNPSSNSSSQKQLTPSKPTSSLKASQKVNPY